MLIDITTCHHYSHSTPSDRGKAPLRFGECMILFVCLLLFGLDFVRVYVLVSLVYVYCYSKVMFLLLFVVYVIVLKVMHKETR